MSFLPEPLLSRLSEHLAAQMGWDFPRARWKDLEAGIEVAARELGIEDPQHCVRELLSTSLTQRQIEALTHAFTVGETYFFRDPRSLAALEEHVLPEMIRARRKSQHRLRIWSAGCCTGEEPYTLAILLDRLLPDISDWQITLLATDINTRFLQKAAEGIFSQWSFRDVPAWLRERYFRPVARSRMAVLPRIRSMVNFAYLNLCEDVYPSLTNNTNAMDLILCRNVLMYFSAERAAHVIHNFHRSLTANGVLLVTAVEASAHVDTYFHMMPFEGAILHRKRSEFEIAAVPAIAALNVPRDIPDAPAALPATYFAKSVLAELVEELGSPLLDRQPDQQPLDAYFHALALFEQGSYQEAIATLLAEPSPTVDRAILLARIHANLGDLVQARQWSERAIAIDRTDAATHYLRAVILQEQDQATDAAIALQRTLYLQPDFVLAHFALGNLEQRQGRGNAASRHFANALNLLSHFHDNDVLPHSDGMAAGQLREMIRSIASADAA